MEIVDTSNLHGVWDKIDLDNMLEVLSEYTAKAALKKYDKIKSNSESNEFAMLAN